MSLEQQQTAAQTEGQEKDFMEQIIEAVTPIINKRGREKDAIVFSVLTDGDKAMSKCMVGVAGTMNNVCNAIDAMNKDSVFATCNLVYKLHHESSMQGNMVEDRERGK